MSISKEKKDPRGRIDFDHLGIGTALSRGHLAVPLNQREYSWEEKQVTELFQDFSNAISNHKSSYFLGTIVLTQSTDEVPQVADGQQRLATTTILLAAMRDWLFHRKEDRRVTSIENDFLFKIDRDTNEIEPRLRLNVDDNEFFRQKILEKPDSTRREIQAQKPSHRRIEKAAELARNHIEDILQPHAKGNQVPVLNSWVKFLEHTAQIIVLKVPDDLSAFVMFETLNDRGLKTSQADLVKNYLFGESDDRIQEAHQLWAGMTGALESMESEDIVLTYLRHLVSSVHGLTRDREVFDRIKAAVAGKSQAISFLGQMSENASDYVAIQTPNHAKWNTYGASIRSSIKTMNALAAVPIRPLMLAVARRFDTGESERAFRLFVSWTVRLLVVGAARSGALEEAYAEAAKGVSSKKIKTTEQIAKAQERIIPSDIQFETEFATARVAKNSLARYYLRSLELQIQGDREPEFIPNENEQVINLEHVLPENPGTAWGHIDSETAAVFHRRIGNMALLQVTKNTKIGNDAFSTKQLVLKASGYKLTKDVGGYPAWGVKEITERQKQLAKIAVKTWPLTIR